MKDFTDEQIAYEFNNRTCLWWEKRSFLVRCPLPVDIIWMFYWPFDIASSRVRMNFDIWSHPFWRTQMATEYIRATSSSLNRFQRTEIFRIKAECRQNSHRILCFHLQLCKYCTIYAQNELKSSKKGKLLKKKTKSAQSKRKVFFCCRRELVVSHQSEWSTSVCRFLGWLVIKFFASSQVRSVHSPFNLSLSHICRTDF